MSPSAIVDTIGSVVRLVSAFGIGIYDAIKAGDVPAVELLTKSLDRPELLRDKDVALMLAQHRKAELELAAALEETFGKR